MKAIKLACLIILVMQLLVPRMVLAAWTPPSHTSTGGTSSSGSSGSASSSSHGSGLNLNLSSAAAGLTLSDLSLAGGLSITVGGQSRVLSLTELLTPAELVAAYQVSTTGGQTLVIGQRGNAVGGVFSLSGGLGQGLGSVDVPRGVELFQSFGSQSTLSLSGDFVNSGKFVVFSTNPSDSNATVNAFDITNTWGASILSGLNLNLSALGNISNAGTVSSSGRLSLSAGGSITNALPSGMSGAAPVMQAAGDLNMYAGSGTFVNAGLISSTMGNINLNSLPGSSISIQNAGGTLSAANGAINVRDASYNGSGNVDFEGGNLLSQTVNSYSGTGNITVNVDQLTGVVNSYAANADITANTANLQLGVLDVTGDPYVANNSGNLDISSVTFPTTFLVGTAEQSIFTSSATTNLSTASSTGNGGNIVLISGVISGNSGGKITAARSTVGGDINLTSGTTYGTSTSQNITGFSTSSSHSGSSGGNVSLIAFASAAGSNIGGHVLLPTGVQVNTQGAGSGSNGNVTVIAEAAAGSANSISTGSLNSSSTTFGKGGGGNVVMKVATPNLHGVSINPTTGAVTGSFNSNSLTPEVGAVSVGNIFTSGFSPQVTVQGGNVTTGAISDASGPVSVQAAGSMTIGGNVQGSTVSLATTASNGGIALGTSNVTASSMATLSTQGSGAITDGGGTITAPTVTLASTSGNIGGSGDGANVLTNARRLSSNSTGTSFVTNTGNVQLQRSSGSTFQLSDSGSVSIGGSVTGTTITIRSTAGNGSIIDYGRIGGTGATVSLTADGSGAVQQLAGSLTGTTVNLTSTSGNIYAWNLDTTNLTANTSGAVSLNAAGDVTLGTSSAGKRFRLMTTDGMTIGNLTATGAPVMLITAKGAMTLTADDTITGSNVTLFNQDGKSGTIALGAGSTITSSSSKQFQGNVNIAVGVLFAQVNQTAPTSNVTPVITSGGRIFYGPSSITADSPTNTLTATGKDITFFVPCPSCPGHTSSITLDGGVHVTATAYDTSDAPAGELVVDTGDDANDDAAGSEVSVLP